MAIQIITTCDQCGKTIPTSGALKIRVEARKANGTEVGFDFDTVLCMRQKMEAMTS